VVPLFDKSLFSLCKLQPKALALGDVAGLAFKRRITSGTGFYLMLTHQRMNFDTDQLK
jgi:hypothetical protein